MSDNKTLHTGSGAPVQENDNTQSAGRRGPLLLQDVWYIEKLAHFVRERIPERVVHAKGSAAYGQLTITGDISKYTKAALFQPGVTTKCLLRFSTVAGERGAADAERDVRGFALKFYTTEGNFDIVGNNTPVFFIRDPLKFPDFIHTQKRDPYTNMRSANSAWDFWSKTPESIHQVMILHSDRGIPKNLRQLNGYGSQTFSLINKEGERFWVKFHFKSLNGIATLSNAQAQELVGADRESSQKDLFENIAQGNFPKWNFQVQIMPEADAEKHAYAFDVTKVWPHQDYPMIDVGTLELNKNPDNYFAEVEQAAFAPSNFVPGVGASPDKMLQGRLFSYQDAHRYRLGVNHHLIPVNQPLNQHNSFHRDGAGRTDANGGHNPNYAPNRFGAYQPTHDHDPLLATEGTAGVYNYREYDEDYYSQPAALYNKVFDDQQRRNLEQNYAESLAGVTDNQIVQTVLEQFKLVDPNLEKNVRALLKL